jgi:hypothetical protein
MSNATVIVNQKNYKRSTNHYSHAHTHTSTYTHTPLPGGVAATLVLFAAALPVQVALDHALSTDAFARERVRARTREGKSAHEKQRVTARERKRGILLGRISQRYVCLQDTEICMLSRHRDMHAYIHALDLKTQRL